MAQDEIEILREQIRQLWGAVVSLQDQVRILNELAGQEVKENPTGDLNR